MFHQGINAGFGEIIPTDRLHGMRDIGCTLVRSDLGPPGYEQEMLIQQLKYNSGMEPLFIVRNQQHVDALPDNSWIELGNEPNLWDASLDRAISPWEYVEYYSPIREAALDRGMRVFVGSLSLISDESLEYLDTILGEWLDVEDVSMHRYPYKIDQRPSRSPFGSREKEMEAFRGVLNGRRFMITEFGIRSVARTWSWNPFGFVRVTEEQRLPFLKEDVNFWREQPDCDGAVVYQEWQGTEKSDLYGIRGPNWDYLPAAQLWY